MRRITLYRCAVAEGIRVSPEKPDGEYTTLIRLVADEGCAITDGAVVTTCVDVAEDRVGEWSDCALPETASFDPAENSEGAGLRSNRRGKPRRPEVTADE